MEVGTAGTFRVECGPRMRFWLALLLVWWLPTGVLAVGQGEALLSGGMGLAVGFQDPARAGAQVDLRLLRGISDSWAARLGLQSAWYPGHGEESATHVTAQSLGLTWAADVLNLVPFADLGIAVADLRGGGRDPSWRLGGQLGIGADYFLSRHLTMSILARIDYYAIRLAGGHDGHPTQVGLALYLGRAF
jgi:hypothetical protein